MARRELSCVVCGQREQAQPTASSDLKLSGPTPEFVLCPGACAEQARRFLARRRAQLEPSIAGLAVSLLGAVAAALFVWSGRDLGRALLVLSVFAAGTTRLAYPDVLPLWLVRSWGLQAASERLQWLGVLLCITAILLALWFLFT